MVVVLMIDDVLLSIILKNKILDVKNYIKLHLVLKKKYTIADAVLSCVPTPCGLERWQQWEKSLFANYNYSDIEKEKIDYYRVKNSINMHEVTSSTTGTNGDIMRDVVRTFQKLIFFQHEQQGYKMLLNILLAIVLVRPDIGYCQGMNYVVATLMIGRLPTAYTGIDLDIKLTDDRYSTTSVEDNTNDDSRATTTIKTSENNYTEDERRNMNIDRDVYDFADDDIADVNNDDNNNQANNNQTRGIINCNNTVPLLPVSSELSDAVEADVFSFMLELLRPSSKLDMSGLWKEGIPKLKLRIYQLDRLLRWTYPQLHSHFTSIELSPEVITSQWFLTLYTYTFPVYPSVLSMWDYIFSTGWEGIYMRR